MPVLDKQILTDGSWTSLESNVYECRVWLHPDLEEGGYSVTSPSLPGLVTEGETAGEALSNAREALRELIAEYKRSGEEIPWQTEIQESPGGVIEKRILVNA